MSAPVVPHPRMRMQRLSTGWVPAPADHDMLAVESPLEIRIEGEIFGITMRTPDPDPRRDQELVAGLLHAERIIDGLDDIIAIRHLSPPTSQLPSALQTRDNTIDVRLAAGVSLARLRQSPRHMFASSACGICGATAIDNLLKDLPVLCSAVGEALTLQPALIASLPAKMRRAQDTFEHTGGLHAAALFDASGTMIALREDIGRHNAVDKLIGHQLYQDMLPLDQHILLVSGRIGFEIVQKAIVAQAGALLALGAPTSLAAQAAEAAGLPLVGFLGGSRYNIYGSPR